MGGRASSRNKTRRVAGALLILFALASCARIVPPPSPEAAPPAPVVAPPPVPPPPADARDAGVRPGPAVATLLSSVEAANRALAAFRLSCPALLARQDASGLTQAELWRAPCDAAATWSAADAIRFFDTFFETATVGAGTAFATGYYEPEIAGSRVRQPGFDVPIYGPPADLLTSNPATGQQGKGRVDETGQYVVYYDRAAIEDGALAGRGLEIAWAADPVDLFFLQIQGSGRLRLPDGSVMRIGYAAQNGREYVAVGRLMRDRGILVSPITMQAVRDWLKTHPDEGRALMRENKSYVFFRELTGAGPLGAMGVSVTPRATVAADPKFVPLGAPVLLTGMDNPTATGLWVAQDTGGAIRGANRFDTFWGAGAEAELIAGGMSAKGTAYLLLPRGTIERIGGGNAPPQP